MAGGVVAILPQAWFAGRVFRGGRAGAELGGDKAAAALVVARRGMAAAGGKFLLTAAGFVIVFAAVKPAAAWAVFAGYGAMLAIQIAGGWMLLRSTST